MLSGRSLCHPSMRPRTPAPCSSLIQSATGCGTINHSDRATRRQPYRRTFRGAPSSKACWTQCTLGEHRIREATTFPGSTAMAAVHRLLPLPCRCLRPRQDLDRQGQQRPRAARGEYKMLLELQRPRSHRARSQEGPAEVIAVAWTTTSSLTVGGIEREPKC